MEERSLYRKHDLAAAPETPFIFLGSEQSADAAQRLLGKDYVATTYPERPGAWQSVDLRPIAGRRGVLLADANPDSKHDIAKLAARLHALDCKLRIASTNGQPEGWTVADFEGGKEEFVAWARQHAKDYEPATETPPPAAQDAPETHGDEIPIEAYGDEGEASLQPPVPLSEDAFARLFADRLGENWRCVRAWGKWFYWDGEAWAEDRTDSRVQPMRELFKAAQDSNEAKQLTESAKRATLGRKAPMYSALILAGTDERIRAEPEIWDADPWALGVPGGVIDLRTGKLSPSARDQHVTMRASVAPQPGTPTLWLKLLKQWLGNDDVIGFLRRYLGYALTGDNREQCMVFFYGKAQSGKGTILRTVSRIMGSLDEGGGKFRSYHYEAPISTFMEARNDRHSTEIAAFYKKRLITSEEPSAGAKWDESKLKWITGGSQITARFIAQDNFSFAMTGKIIVAANHRPRLSTTDKAIRRRMMVIPFEHPIADEDRDNELDAKIRAEYPQILHWLIQGCLEWQEAGLGQPEQISAATDNYLESEDTLGAWMAENCEMSGESSGQTLYENYARWCEIQGETRWSRRAWSNAVIERGFVQRKSHGERIFVAIQPKVGSNL